MGGVFKDDLIINEVVAANVEEKEKRQTEKLIDNTSERNVLVGQVVGLVENSRLVVNLLEDRLVDPVQEKYSQKEPITTIGLDTELIATNGRATDIKELVNGCKEKRVEPKRSWATVVEDLVNSGQALSKIDQEVNSSETEPEIEHFDFPEDKKGKRNSDISESERRKRDRALKRRKWNKLHLDESEISGKSLSDSDISNRVSKLVKEAKHVLKVGKKMGFNIVGEENDIINDLVELELKEAKEN
ncbi:hypothetical protein V6N13_129506 [Hibiscus sabdariffa]